MSMDISKELVYRRKQKGMTQAELAREAHISKAYLWQLEREPGKAPSAEILHRICEVLGTGIENFFHVSRYCQRCGHDFAQGEWPYHITAVIGYACGSCAKDYGKIKQRHTKEIQAWVNMR